MTGQATGASKSLNKTISELMKFLKDEGDRPRPPLRAGLNEKIGDLALKWYGRGFRRGHRETSKQSRRGRVPRILRYDATREFFTGDERTVRITSRLP